MKYPIVFLLLLLSVVAGAQTNVSGGIYANTTWTRANSPYIVTGEMTLFAGNTLTIEPGVVVRFDNGVRFNCRGKLVAVGTAADSITFQSNSPTPQFNSWAGFVVQGTEQPYGSGNQVRMEYVKAMHAAIFMQYSTAYNGPYEFRNSRFHKNYIVSYGNAMGGITFDGCTFTENTTGVYEQYGSGWIRNCVFSGNQSGVLSSGPVENCVFYGNTLVGMEPYGGASGNTVYNNNRGVRAVFGPNTNPVFNNNRVYANAVGIEMYAFINGGVSFNNNIICSNAEYNLKNISNYDPNLPNTCWCLADSAQIRARIHDGYLDITKGIVRFMPFTTGCNAAVSVPALTVVRGALRVYPNPLPAGATLRVELPRGIRSGELSITSASGAVVYRAACSGRSISVRARLLPGSYFISVRSGSDLWTATLMGR